MKKIAICLGLNQYPDPRNNLRGCVNDALDLADYFKKVQGVTDITVLTDSKVKVSKASQFIINKIKECSSGDHFILTNSSHGSSVPDKNGDEIDGRDEVLCWHDGFLNDDLIRQIIDFAPAGVNITIMSDSCHSGTVTRDFIPTGKTRIGYRRAKFIVPSDPEFAAKINQLPVRKRAVSKAINEEQMKEILISGCKSNEFSYDAYINKRNNGAFTRASLDILYGNKNLTYTQFYTSLMTKLPSAEFSQTPQLEGSSVNKNRIMFS